MHDCAIGIQVRLQPSNAVIVIAMCNVQLELITLK